MGVSGTAVGCQWKLLGVKKLPNSEDLAQGITFGRS